MKSSELKLRILHKNPKNVVWKDKGSGARRDGSFWTLTESIGDFKLLGDVVCGQANTENQPCERTILVEDKNGNNPILSKPKSSSLIWTEAGSGAHSNVKIYRLNPEKGYICLGMVAVQSGNPDLDRYRCVRNDFVDDAKLQGNLWDDGGSGAHSHFTAYGIQATHATLSTGLFHGFASYNHGANLKTDVYALIRSKTEET